MPLNSPMPGEIWRDKFSDQPVRVLAEGTSVDWVRYETEEGDCGLPVTAFCRWHSLVKDAEAEA